LGDAYVLERELGGGGMSRVFLALERALGRKVVVKVLLPELAADVNVERFRREIQLAAQLQHPHIVPLLSAGEAEGLPYFIMPFVTGESLRARVAREGEFPIAETVRILRDVVSALAYAHANGIVHRDVKPDNVLLSGGVAVVTDFGVAKAVSASSGGSGDVSLTSRGIALGTPAYMSPEQATATPNTDHRADIYALGIMAYEMLTGAPPFSGRSTQQVLAAQVVEEPEPVERRRPAVPPMLASLVKECLAKRPADRPQTAADVMHALDAIATPSGGTAATATVRRPVGGAISTRRRSSALVVSVLGLAVLVGGGVLWLRRSQTTPLEGPPASASLMQPPQAAQRAPANEDSSASPKEPPLPDRAPSSEGRAQRQARTATPLPDRSTGERSRAPSRRTAPPAQDSVAPEAAPETPPPVESTVIPPVAAAPPAAAVPVNPLQNAPAAVPPPLPAPPPRPADPSPEIRGVVAEYARAIESESVRDLRRAYPGMTPTQERGWEQFFRLVRDVKADLSVARLDRSSGTADAQITGTYTYLNTSTGRAESQPVSFQASFSNRGGEWRMSEVR
jgi:serine/threonine protein kinase